MFIDEVNLKVVAGKGGDGCSSFLREKFMPLGGPDGGNGGKGGSIVFKADKGLRTLIDLRYNKLLKGGHGEMGRGRNQTGASAEDRIIIVPVGTTIKDTDTNLIICDLVEDGQECVVAKGGRGGKGNAAFMSNKNKAPLTSELGEPGEERNIQCELKLLADVGLVGFPSVGKSSLISVISAAKPKIADYHFTTLTPNLGVVKAEDYSCQFQYWDAHIKLIDSLAGYNMDVVIEDYLLYSDRANNQINSRLETPQLLGIIKYEAYKRGLFIYIQPAMLVKKRWSNETLAYKGYVKAEARGKVSIAGRTVVTHIQDSIRHAIHYKTYVSKYKSKGVRR